MHVQTVLVDTSWLHNVWEMILLFIKFKYLRKNRVPEKIKPHLPEHPPALQQLFSPHLLNFIQKIFSSTPFKKEGRDYAFCMIAKERIKLLPFYMTDFLFTEL